MLVGTRLAANPTAPASKLIPPVSAKGESGGLLALTAGDEEHHNALALFDPNGHLATRKQKSSNRPDDSDSEQEEDIPLGPVDPDRCIVTGPGFSGGAAKAKMVFKIYAKDSNGKNLKEGGDYIIARVIPGTAAEAGGADMQLIEIVDNNNGTYTGTYSVPVRGDYELEIDVNGAPLGGSPFPLYFSPPEATPEPEVAAPAAAGTGVEPAAAAAAVAATLAPVKPSVGPAAVAAGVELPSNEEDARRTVLVGNVSMLVVSDQLKALFSFAGEVLSCKIVGSNRQYAFVEYSKPEEADAAQAMHNMHVAGQPISVETCLYAKQTVEKASNVVPANPLVALQLQQLMSQPSVAVMQQQQRQLAEQVASLRAAQRANPTTTKVAPANSVSQKAAAMAAAAALAKKLGGKGPATAAAKADGEAADEPRARSTSRDGRTESRQRSRSRPNERSRSRSRDRGRPSSRRSRSEERRRRDASREARERREREMRRARDASRDRRERERDRRAREERDRRSSPARGSRRDDDRSSRRDRDAERREDKRTDRDADRKLDRSRDRRDADTRRDRDDHRRKERDDGKRRDKDANSERRRDKDSGKRGDGDSERRKDRDAERRGDGSRRRDAEASEKGREQDRRVSKREGGQQDKVAVEEDHEHQPEAGAAAGAIPVNESRAAAEDASPGSPDTEDEAAVGAASGGGEARQHKRALDAGADAQTPVVRGSKRSRTDDEEAGTRGRRRSDHMEHGDLDVLDVPEAIMSPEAIEGDAVATPRTRIKDDTAPGEGSKHKDKKSKSKKDKKSKKSHRD